MIVTTNALTVYAYSLRFSVQVKGSGFRVAIISKKKAAEGDHSTSIGRKA
jgi:hypothetical protein